MARYAIGRARPKAELWDDTPMLPHLEVDEHEPADTGLITVTGEPIYRLPRPIGFGRDKEW